MYLDDVSNSQDETFLKKKKTTPILKIQKLLSLILLKLEVKVE